MNTSQSIFEKLWNDYLEFNPHVREVYQHFVDRGETVLNDHIALRTFNLDGLGIDRLARDFVALGYVPRGEYHFETKKLYAKHFEGPHPDDPRLFISELRVELMPQSVQDVIHSCAEGQAAALADTTLLCMAGRPWEASYAVYQELYKHSEYAAWTYAFGFRPNHFTISINALNTLETVEEVNDMLKEKGVILNTSGGEVKGSKALYLEQSSIMAGTNDLQFSDGVFNIPACYYEFALRHPMENGELYQGFVAGSADKIFESTNAQ